MPACRSGSYHTQPIDPVEFLAVIGFQIVSEKFYTVDDFNPHITKFNKMIIVWYLASS
jgi:hypothetical protein